MINKSIKVLISAYACEPEKGSEPGVGWNWAKQIATFAETWVITRTNNREVIEEELQKNPVSNLHFIFVDLPKLMRFWKKGQRGIHLYYYLWQIATYLKGKKLNKVINFDVVHHLTFGVYSSPCFLSLLHVPFIWGPIGGIDAVPKTMREVLSSKGRIYEFIRDLWHKVKFKYDPFLRITLKRSKFILCRTQKTCEYLKNFKNEGKVKVMSETGWPNSQNFWKKINNSSFKIFSAGRLVPLKGFPLSIEAFSEFNQNIKNSKFEIAGEGYDKKRLQDIARKKRITDKIDFLGEIPRWKVIENMKNCDVFLYTSLREGGAWSVMEALSSGRPVICLDHSGPGEMVTEECGIKVKPNNLAQTINDLAEALLKLANDPDLRRKMGQAGRKRVEEHYTWDKKGEFIKKLYYEVLEDEGPLRT